MTNKCTKNIFELTTHHHFTDTWNYWPSHPTIYDKDLNNTFVKLKLLLTNNSPKFPNGNFGDDDAIVKWDGYRRLTMMEELVIDTLNNKIDGDLAEAGVWKGGMTILFAAIIKHYNISKKIFNFDSFSGCPSIDKNDKQVLSLGNSEQEIIKQFDSRWSLPSSKQLLACPLDIVRNNFKKFNLLDNNICFVKGYFCDTLPNFSCENGLSILRIDCDLYQSTYEVLEYLYPYLNPGGYVIFDDYKFGEARQAIIDYREKNNIKTKYYLGKTFDPILYWKKE